MKWSFRFKFGRITFFSMLSLTQTVTGITSLVENVGKVLDNKHIVMFDLENTTLKKVVRNMNFIQYKFHLGEIFIFGDSEKGNTFNAICFTPVRFEELLKILLCADDLDYLFYKYTVMRGKSTIRLTKKKGRGKQKVLFTIEGKKESIPPEMEKVIYDTGLSKVGRLFEWVKK